MAVRVKVRGCPDPQPCFVAEQRENKLSQEFRRVRSLQFVIQFGYPRSVISFNNKIHRFTAIIRILEVTTTNYNEV